MTQRGVTAPPSIEIPKPTNKVAMRKEVKAKLDKAMEAVKEAARKLKDESDQPTVTEDAFSTPPDKPKHEPPPNDPDPPSGSLSSDEEGVSSEVRFALDSKP